jgi:LPS-assembly protein
MLRWLSILAVTMAVAVFAPIALAQAPGSYNLQGRAQKLQSNNGEQVLITADEVSYDQELGTIIARGSVEIVQGKRVLIADSISYNQKTDTVSASGNISLLEPTGEVIFAEYIELTDEFKNGLVKELRILLTDESRFAAGEAIRVDGNRTIMRRAVFSPCKPCKDDPQRSPLWQLKAQTIVHDQESQEIIYQNAFLEIYGVPIAYTPYLSHPDPTVHRRSGFLAPNFGAGGDLGGFIQAPFFLVLGDDKDATIADNGSWVANLKLQLAPPWRTEKKATHRTHKPRKMSFAAISMPMAAMILTKLGALAWTLNAQRIAHI